jgi:formylglycine-generating enzyme
VCGAMRSRPFSPIIGDGFNGPRGRAWIPAGTFLMGSTAPRAQPNEGPAHEVSLTGFWMNLYDVTNTEFTRFVLATGYHTTAELPPRWEDLAPQLPPDTRVRQRIHLSPGGWCSSEATRQFR